MYADTNLDVHKKWGTVSIILQCQYESVHQWFMRAVNLGILVVVLPKPVV